MTSTIKITSDKIMMQWQLCETWWVDVSCGPILGLDTKASNISDTYPEESCLSVLALPTALVPCVFLVIAKPRILRFLATNYSRSFSLKSCSIIEKNMHVLWKLESTKMFQKISLA